MVCLVASLLGGYRPSGPSLEQKLRYLEAENTMLRRAVESKNRQLAKLTAEVERLKALVKEAAGEGRKEEPDPPKAAKPAEPAPAAEVKPAPKEEPAKASPPAPAAPAASGRTIKLTGAYASDTWTKGRPERLEAVFTPTADAQTWTVAFAAAFRDGTQRFTGTLRGNPRQGTISGPVRASSGRTFTFEGRADAGRISARAFEQRGREGNQLQATLTLK